MKLDTLVTAEGERTKRQSQFKFVVEVQAANVIDIQDGYPFIKLGQFRLEDIPVSRTLMVTRGPHPMQWDTLRCQAYGQGIAAHVARIDTCTWKLDVTLNAISNLGYLRGKLDFSFFNRGELLPYQLTRRVEAQMVGPILASPSSILFGAVRVGERAQRVVRLSCTSGSQEPLKVVSVASSDPNRAWAAIGERGDKEDTISIVFREDHLPGRYAGRIVVRAELDAVYEMHIAYVAYVVGDDGHVSGAR